MIDHEHITGLGPEPFEVAVVYEIRDGLIQTLWSFGADNIQGIAGND
ncbi:hypothetical protein [Shewanella litorisediminis]|nr:hypothetical protein [Shewanella litorisediminis]MCL2917255.1 hypothetical protein [Shewanella litorisediminis]